MTYLEFSSFEPGNENWALSFNGCPMSKPRGFYTFNSVHGAIDVCFGAIVRFWQYAWVLRSLVKRIILGGYTGPWF